MQEYQKQCPHVFANTRKNNIFCRRLANTRPTKELKAFFCVRRKAANFFRPVQIYQTHRAAGRSNAIVPRVFDMEYLDL